MSGIPEYNITTALFTDSFANIQFAGTEIILSVLLTLICVVVITRNISKWGMIAYPINLLWHKIGVESPLVLQIALGIYLLYTIMGSSGISRIVNTISKTAKTTGQIFTDTYERATPNRQLKRLLKLGQIEHHKTGINPQIEAIEKSYKSLIGLGVSTKEARKSAINMGIKDTKAGKKLLENYGKLKTKGIKINEDEILKIPKERKLTQAEKDLMQVMESGIPIKMVSRMQQQKDKMAKYREELYNKYNKPKRKIKMPTINIPEKKQLKNLDKVKDFTKTEHFENFMTKRMEKLGQSVKVYQSGIKEYMRKYLKQ